ncbi:MAG: DNA internalization-related competence protein ComEC/Rec2 [Oscillospiraceae bacterium]|nr:DNA internalization-related competence protein ComEC/Rec2 [Oscillospiraceae bacterium]
MTDARLPWRRSRFGRLAPVAVALRSAVLSRRLASFSIAFAAATVSWQIVPAWYWLLLPAVALAVGVGFLRESSRVVAIVLTTGFFLGSIWCLGHDLLFLRPAQDLDRQRGEITVYVTTLPRETPYFTDVRGRLVREDGINIPMTLRLDEMGEPLQPGDTITVDAILYRADEVGGQRAWRHTADGIFLRAFASGAYTITDSGSRIWYFPQYLNRAVAARVAEIFSPDTVGFLTAVLTGNRSYMDAGIYENLRRSGIAHLVAVSGMHVVLLTSLLMLLMGKSRRTTFVAIPLIILFAVMTGASPSTSRAALMQTMLLIAPLFHRETDKMTSLSAALLFLLLLNPLVISSVTLQLSFLAIVGMFGLTPRVKQYLTGLIQAETPIGKWARKFVATSIATTLGATAFTTPILVFHMGAIPLYSPLTDLLTVWAATFIFGAGVIVTAVGFIFLPLAQILAYPVMALVHYVQWIASGIAQFPVAILWTYSGYIQVWLVVVAAIVALYCLYRGDKPRAFLPISLSAGLLIFCLFLGGLEARSSGHTVTILDVGQGKSVVLTTPDTTAIVDIGSGRGQGSRAGHIAAEYLFSRNIYALDFLILTHFHQDHINGAGHLMQRIPIGRLLIPDRPEGNAAKDRILDLAAEWDVPVYIIRSNTVFPSETGTLTVFAPFTRDARSENNRGLAVLKSVGEFDTLITGDMYTDMEQRMVQLVDLPSLEVLVVGHHGSRTSTSAELLEATRPRVAIASAGLDNQHGHPHAEVVVRLHEFGSSIYRTDRSGTITVRAGN